MREPLKKGLLSDASEVKCKDSIRHGQTDAQRSASSLLGLKQAKSGGGVSRALVAPSWWCGEEVSCCCQVTQPTTGVLGKQRSLSLLQPDNYFLLPQQCHQLLWGKQFCREQAEDTLLCKEGCESPRMPEEPHSGADRGASGGTVLTPVCGRSCVWPLLCGHYSKQGIGGRGGWHTVSSAHPHWGFHSPVMVCWVISGQLFNLLDSHLLAGK